MSWSPAHRYHRLKLSSISPEVELIAPDDRYLWESEVYDCSGKRILPYVPRPSGSLTIWAFPGKEQKDNTAPAMASLLPLTPQSAILAPERFSSTKTSCWLALRTKAGSYSGSSPVRRTSLGVAITKDD